MYHVYEDQAVDGYVLTSKRNYQVCQTDRTFSNHEITCSRRVCSPVVPHIENAVTSPNSAFVLEDTYTKLGKI